MSGALLLITIPFSHYCEKARWVLDRAGLDYEERRFLPVLHMSATVPRGGRSTPMLLDGKERYTDSTDIALYVDSRVPESSRLYPQNAALRQEALELEDLFDRRLGPHARRWIYFHVLGDRDYAMRFMSVFGDGAQFRLFSRGFPLFRFMMRTVMRIDATSAERSRRYVYEMFDRVSAMLQDGREFLVGDRLSIADVTFASLGAPVVLPPNYGGPTVPSIPSVPSHMMEEVSALRSTLAGRFITRLYESERLARALP
jgi:glutathione S-transferase